MNKIKSLQYYKVIFISLTLIFLSSFAIADNENVINKNQTITITYSFNNPYIEKVKINEKIYDKIIVPDLINSADPGEPYLPAKGAYILLPKNTEIKKINVFPSNKEYLGSDHYIIPCGEPIPLSMTDYEEKLEPNPEIYNSLDLFPGNLFNMIDNYFFRGYNILVLMLNPIQYVPATGEIFYYNNLTITIELADNKNSNTLLRGLINDKIEVLNKVDNPDIIETYYKEDVTNVLNQYDLLILTTENLKQSFQPLKYAHEERGVRTEIKTLKEISIFPELVSPENIRDFIKNEYLNNGIEFVLLGGDADIVPAKMLYVSGLDEGKWFYETEMPSDLYYACLDGEYNSDGDDKWGEPNDGDNGGDVDLIADIFIGRACVDNIQDVDNFVSKTIDYLDVDFNEEYLKNVCFAGEYLGDYGIASWGGNYLDQLIDESEFDEYNTIGIPSDNYNIDKLYDREWLNNDWEKEEMIQRINNNNIHIINHDGHSNYIYNMKMVTSDIEMLTNDNYFFAYSIGCMAGGFDDPNGYDCFAEFLNVKTDNGAFAVIMNARYGWFWSYSTDGDSSRYTRQFWDAVFGEKIPIISKANQDSKEDNLFLIERSCMRWTYYQLNLFGDPSIAFHISNPPDKPLTPSGVSTGKPGEEYIFITNSTDPENDKIFYLFDWDDENFSDWLGPYNSGEICETSHIWDEEGSYSIKVKAKDENGIESPWSDPLSITMPKNTELLNNLIFKFIEKISHIISFFII